MPYTADPTQAVFVVKLVSRQGVRALLIVRIQPLIERLHSMSTDACVHWEVWGSDAVVMGVSRRDGSNGGPYPLVCGARVIIVKRTTTPAIDGRHHNLCTFDFSRRGWNILPLRDEGDGVERRVGFKDGRNILLQGNRDMDEWGFSSLGDGRFMYLVSHFRCQRVVGC